MGCHKWPHDINENNDPFSETYAPGEFRFAADTQWDDYAEMQIEQAPSGAPRLILDGNPVATATMNRGSQDWFLFDVPHPPVRFVCTQ